MAGATASASALDGHEQGGDDKAGLQGAGESIYLKELSPARLRAAISRVLENPEYARTAADMQAAILKSGGVKGAAAVIEQVLF